MSAGCWKERREFPYWNFTCLLACLLCHKCNQLEETRSCLNLQYSALEGFLSDVTDGMLVNPERLDTLRPMSVWKT